MNIALIGDFTRLFGKVTGSDTDGVGCVEKFSRTDKLHNCIAADAPAPVKFALNNHSPPLIFSDDINAVIVTWLCCFGLVPKRFYKHPYFMLKYLPIFHFFLWHCRY